VARFSTAPIPDSDTDADPPYIVTEFIDGPTLSQVVTEQGPLSGSQLHALGVGVAGALTAIHSAGIVHRDLKTGSIRSSPTWSHVRSARIRAPGRPRSRCWTNWCGAAGRRPSCGTRRRRLRQVRRRAGRLVRR